MAGGYSSPAAQPVSARPQPERGGVSWVQCDVRDSAAVDKMVSEAAETLGGLDVLLHAAGLWQPGIPG